MKLLKALIVLQLFFHAEVWGDSKHVLESPQITNWGTWGEVESCPPGYFVTGMQLKVERAEGWKDDTGLNGVRLFCSRLGKSVDIYEETPVPITSSVGPYGEWKSVFRCGDQGLDPKTTAAVGFQLRVEPPNGAKDDTSANDFRIFCRDLEDTNSQEESHEQRLVVEGDGTHWGAWTEAQLCKSGYAICGIVTQIDHGLGKTGYDDTGLNNVRAECCKIHFHNVNVHDHEARSKFDEVMFPDPVESAHNLDETLSSAAHDISDTGSETGTSVSPKDALDVDHAHDHEYHTESPPLEGALDNDLTHLSSLDFQPPEIRTEIPIRTDQNPELNNSSPEITVGPLLPPEVVHFIETELKDDHDPDPERVHVIAGSISTSPPTTTPGNERVRHSGNQLLISEDCSSYTSASAMASVISCLLIRYIL